MVNWEKYWEVETIPKEIKEYRYALICKKAGNERRKVIVIMLNPSRANSESNDKTMENVLEILENEGFNKIIVLNLFGWINSEQKELVKKIENEGIMNAIGKDNDETIYQQINEAETIVIAWGETKHFKNRVILKERVENVMGFFRGQKTMCRGWTISGHPRHGLRWEKKVKLKEFNVEKYIKEFK